MKYIKSYKIFENLGNIDFNDLYTKKIISDEDNFQEVIDILERDCSKFLDEVASKCLVYRGYSTKSEDREVCGGMLIKTPRKDRTAMGTPKHISKIFDDEFEELLGHRMRSEGVFTSTNRKSTALYGQPRIFIPLGDYEYFWNPAIHDLYPDALRLPHQSSDDFKPEMDKIVQGYISNRIEEADKNEIIFMCKRYYLLDTKYEDKLIEYISKRNS